LRDLIFVAFLGAFFLAGLRKPFIFVLAYIYIDVVSPQRLTYLLLNSIPISLIAFCAATLSWALIDDKRDVRMAPRQIIILLLLAYCGITTLNADFPQPAADKWDWVWKALVFAAFLPLTLRTKLRIEALLLFMVLSASSIIIVGGIKTVVSGGGYGELNLMVSNNSGLYEGSIISTVAVAIVPLVLWFSNHGTIFKPDWKVKVFCYALVFACCMIPVGTSARTGLLCIVLVAVLLLRDAKRKMLYIGVIAGLCVVAVPFLPAAFVSRMGTIKTYKADESASTRLAVWQWTWNYAKTHPFGGGFDMYRQDVLNYDLIVAEGTGSNMTLKHIPTSDRARAYHSSYFEMLGEQGWPGIVLWGGLNLIGIFRMEMLRRRYRKAGPEDAWVAPLAGALQSALLIYLLGASFVGIAFQPFIYQLIGAQIGLDTYLARKRSEGAWRPFRKAKREVERVEPAAPALA
jgi:probable O-glycosylation ligase (exosortase A-associated)